MREDSVRRRLDKANNNKLYDSEHCKGDTRRLNKTIRSYSKALIEAELDEMEEDREEERFECIICDKLTTEPCCSVNCFREAKAMGLVK